MGKKDPSLLNLITEDEYCMTTPATSNGVPFAKLYGSEFCYTIRKPFESDPKSSEICNFLEKKDQELADTTECKPNATLESSMPPSPIGAKFTEAIQKHAQSANPFATSCLPCHNAQATNQPYGDSGKLEALLRDSADAGKTWCNILDRIQRNDSKKMPPEWSSNPRVDLNTLKKYAFELNPKLASVVCGK